MYYGSEASFQPHFESVFDDPYVGQQTIALAITKFITTTPAFHCPATPTSSLDLYIARVIDESRVPKIVPYAALYILMTISRSCTCERPVPAVLRISSSPNNEPKHHYSSLFHHISQVFTRSRLSLLRRFSWIGHHFFVGAFLVALRTYHSDVDVEMMSESTGFTMKELQDLETAIVDSMDSKMGLTVDQMIKERRFRSLKDIECPLAVLRRKRVEKEREEEYLYAHSPVYLRRLRSIRRSREGLNSSKSSSSISSFDSWRSTPTP
ncbi:hypothetical protein D9756_008274 [Leucocoprinus leucothites]|uniref:Uncharacterized protein n=1 Tax=Leucocoprinus leucothites TaxID=201217 RepID=A0A8H5D2L0_9AGAR|nr:hypothetical protein D9756_008274 [Leucoagaricus leucothites]